MMKCIICEKEEAMENSLVCKRCSSKIRRNSLKKFEKMRLILDVIREFGCRWVSTGEISSRVNIPARRLKKYLCELLELGVVEKRLALRLKDRDFRNWRAIWRVRDEHEED